MITKSATKSVRRKFKSGLSLPDKFWSQVDVRGACWLWGGAVDKDGYGQIFNPETRRPVKAHRLSWVLIVGPIPATRHVLHHCDVRNCVNPAHLFLGDQAMNMRDAAAKGRLRVARPNRRGVPFSVAHRAALSTAASRRGAPPVAGPSPDAEVLRLSKHRLTAEQ